MTRMTNSQQFVFFSQAFHTKTHIFARPCKIKNKFNDIFKFKFDWLNNQVSNYSLTAACGTLT